MSSFICHSQAKWLKMMQMHWLLLRDLLVMHFQNLRDSKFKTCWVVGKQWADWILNSASAGPAPLSMLDHVLKRTESHVVLRLLWVFVSLEHVCPQADCLCVRNSASQLAWYACGRVPLCYITCRWVELWVHPVCVSFSVENSRNCEWLPWHAHHGVGCRFVGWMLVGFLASTLDLFEVQFHVLYLFCVRKAFCRASHVRLSCKLHASAVFGCFRK